MHFSHFQWKHLTIDEVHLWGYPFEKLMRFSNVPPLPLESFQARCNAIIVVAAFRVKAPWLMAHQAQSYFSKLRLPTYPSPLSNRLFSIRSNLFLHQNHSPSKYPTNPELISYAKSAGLPCLFF